VPLTYLPAAGESIHQAAAGALSIADAHGRPVPFQVNGTPAEARPGERPGAVALRWFERRRLDAVSFPRPEFPRLARAPIEPARTEPAIQPAPC
jgi:hypothetical protein